jgi:hypothetical protein
MIICWEEKERKKSRTRANVGVEEGTRRVEARFPLTAELQW